MFKTKVSIPILILLILIVILSVGLEYSSRVRKVISSIINPYNPLEFSIKSNVQQKTEEWEPQKDLFPIFAFNLPDTSKDLTESLKIIESCGINIIINGNFSWMPEPYKVKDAFMKLGKSNLKWMVILENECKDDFIYCNTNDNSNKSISEFLKQFNYDFVYGYYVWDEPGKNIKYCTLFNLAPNDDFSDIDKMISQIRADSSLKHKLDFVNLFPTYWEGTPDFDSYRKYVDAFVNSMKYKPRVICFDHYPILKDEFGGFRKDFYANIEIIREKSLQFNIPFWMIILSSEHLNYRKPTIEEIKLQAYSALAYGAQGIGYYIFSKSWEHYGYKSWIFDKNLDVSGLPDSAYGEMFAPIKQINKNIRLIGNLLRNFISEEVIHFSAQPNKQQLIKIKNNSKDSFLTLDKKLSSNDLLLGIFKNDKKVNTKYFVIVNKNLNLMQRYNIIFKKEVIIQKLNLIKGVFDYKEKSKNLSLEISPGEIEVYEVIYE